MAIIRPSLNFVAHPNGNPSAYLTCTRSTVNTAYTNAVGNLMVSPKDTIRQNFDIGTREFMGILAEASSTNIVIAQGKNTRLTSSENGYTVANATYAVGTGQGVKDSTSGSLSNNCSDITTTGTAGVITLPLTVTNGTKYSISWFIRKHKLSANNPQVQLVANGTAITTYTWTIEETASWKRIGTVFTASGTSSPIGIRILNACRFYLDYLQVEAGNRTSTIYQGSPGGTRASDLLYLNQTLYNSGIIDPNEGTFYIEFHPGENVSKFQDKICGIFTLGGQDGANCLWAYIAMNGSGGATIQDYIGSSPIAKTQVDLNSWYKYAITYKTGETFRSIISGGSILTLSGDDYFYVDTSATGKLAIGHLSTGATEKFYLDGHIRHFAYFPKYMSATDITSLVS